VSCSYLYVLLFLRMKPCTSGTTQAKL